MALPNVPFGGRKCVNDPDACLHLVLYKRVICYTTESSARARVFCSASTREECQSVTDFREYVKKGRVFRTLFERFRTIGSGAIECLKFPKAELPELAKASVVLPDYKNNPRVATEAEILSILEESYRR